MDRKTLTQVLATREAGTARRCHIVAAKQQPHRRLSDFFEEVMRDGLGEAEA